MVDVCIVGAGIGGLVAARLLAAQGVSVVVLEARSRVGGRAVSVPVEGGAVDLGATWFWANEPRMHRLLADLRISVFQQEIAGDAVYDTSTGPQRMNGNPLDAPAQRFAYGTGSFVEAILRDLPDGMVRQNEPVTAVVRRDDCWLVTSASGSTSCRHVVIAIPPALAVESIIFDPGLPADLRSLAAATPVWMGSTTKVVALFEYGFWRETGLSGSGMSHVGPLRELHDMSGPDGAPAALFGFASSPTDVPVNEADVVVQLARMFGPNSRTPSRMLVMDWARERYTSPQNVRELTNYATFGHRLYQSPMFDGTVHWGSTETAPSQPGHLEGALAAAERCAANIRRHDTAGAMNLPNEQKEPR